MIRLTEESKRLAGDLSAVNYERVTYEGYGPSGIAIIVEALTDNKEPCRCQCKKCFHKGKRKNRACRAAFLTALMKGDRLLLIRRSAISDADELMMAALDAGAEDFSEEEDS